MPEAVVPSFPAAAGAALPLPELYRRVERHIPPFEWPILADDIAAILELKRRREAVVLAHNYQTPDIFYTVADDVGDRVEDVWGLVVVRQHDGVALPLQFQDRGNVVGQDRPFEGGNVPFDAPVQFRERQRGRDGRGNGLQNGHSHLLVIYSF